MSALPAWLWSGDASHILWANPTGAAIFGCDSPSAIAGFGIDPKSSAALQIARLAASLPRGAATRLERLRGMGAPFGQSLVCACSRVALDDGTPAILVAATQPAGPSLSLEERAKRLLAGLDEPLALFSSGGALLAATPAAQARLERSTSLEAFGAGGLAAQALASGRAQRAALALERIGADTDTALLATFSQPQPEAADSGSAAAVAAPAAEPPPDIRQAEPPAEVPPPASADAIARDEVLAASPEAPAQPPAPQQTSPAATRPPAQERRQPHQPLRFVWQMDADERFTLGSDEFAAMLGPSTSSWLGKRWPEIAGALGVDPQGQVARAIASRDTWSGVVVTFPVDGSGEKLAAELSGLPVFDRDRTFRGYRGFGVCRDVALLDAIMRRRIDAPREEPPPIRDDRAALSIVPPSPNVVPFRSSTPAEPAPSLTAVERKAFGELASRLTARLREAENEFTQPPSAQDANPAAGAATPGTAASEPPPPARRAPSQRPAPDATQDQRPILDRLPVGVLVYRLDQLIYANRAFLDWTGYGDLGALAAAGGLDALFIEPTAGGPRENNGAKTITIASQSGEQLPVEARLFSTPWEGESALVLMFANAAGSRSPDAAPAPETAEAAELRAVLDAAADGVAILDLDGRIVSVNRSAETLFGYESRELAGTPFAGLLETESQKPALDAFAHAVARGASDDGHPPVEAQLTGRSRQGQAIALAMTLGAIGANGRFCAVFRDIGNWKAAERALIDARQQAERASSAKSEFLAKISHEIRTPLNAIIGFSEVMMQERFGPIGNERYKQYLKDIHASGGHLVSLLNDLLDLSKIEAGKLELNFSTLDLNELTQQCVALMQPQANRASSFAPRSRLRCPRSPPTPGRCARSPSTSFPTRSSSPAPAAR